MTELERKIYNGEHLTERELRAAVFECDEITTEYGEMTEERYQYLNSLSLEEYDKETSANEQEAFCEYQHKYHPDEVLYYQTHDPND